MTDPIQQLLADHPLIDGHNDLLWRARELVGYDFDRLDIATGTAARTHTDLPRLREGGVGGQFWSVYVPGDLAGDEAVSQTLEQVDAAHRMIARYDALSLARTADEVTRAWQAGRIASLLGAEGGHSINSSLGTLRMLHVLGVRYLTLTHNLNVPWADSATDVERLGGLSRFGVEVVREMNRIGMMVDLSHTSAGTMRDALDAAEAPVLFSHSSARAVADHPRNVPDDVLARLAGNGGVCMVTFVPKFVSPAAAAWHREVVDAAAAEGITNQDYARMSEFQDRWEQTRPAPGATLEDVVAHCEHVREVAGVEHIGLGGDYDGVGALPNGLEDVRGYPRLLQALADRGWSREDLSRLTGRNVLRVLRDCEDVARELQQRRGPSLATRSELDAPTDVPTVPHPHG